MENSLQNLQDRVLWREFYRKNLLLKLKRPHEMDCPFDENARCSITPGVSCAEISCPVWQGVADNDIMVLK